MTSSANITGKTYSLYGHYDSTEEYYNGVTSALDKLLEQYPDRYDLLKKFRRADKSLRRAGIYLKDTEDELSQFLTDVEGHLHQISFFTKLRGSSLSRKPYQYLLNMIEIELTNRINKDEFLNCSKKIALLPHCLRDLSKNCKAKKDDIDFVCRKCSPNCFINKATKLLNENNIKAYIWKEAGKGLLFNKKRQHSHSLGILGIACIPELTDGMRYCSKRGLPVLGLPLDANRCVRWMGDFYDNSINLNRLEKLISINK